jgi:hypothetical protein
LPPGKIMPSAGGALAARGGNAAQKVRDLVEAGRDFEDGSGEEGLDGAAQVSRRAMRITSATTSGTTASAKTPALNKRPRTPRVRYR